MTKEERIARNKERTGSRNKRKLLKYSNNFRVIFSFLLAAYRRDLISFCGSDLVHTVQFDINGDDAMLAFRNYDNGNYGKPGVTPLKPIVTRHPNLIRTIILAKKGWGLWMKEWSLGIREGSFTRREILEQFDGIVIPEPFMQEFYNNIYKT